MARTLDQIVAELNPTYQAQVDSINQRKAAIPGQIEAEEKGLQAKQENAFGDILSGARRRGLGFSGIPLAEQAKYTSTEFLPALARLRQSGRDQEQSLQDAILGIYERRDTLANQLRQQEIDRDWQREQFERQLAESRRAAAASAASSFAPTMGALSQLLGGNSGASAKPAAATKEDNLYSAAKHLYSRLGIHPDATSSLSNYVKMAKGGNKNASQILNYFYQLRKQAPPASLKPYL